MCPKELPSSRKIRSYLNPSQLTPYVGPFIDQPPKCPGRLVPVAPSLGRAPNQFSGKLARVLAMGRRGWRSLAREGRVGIRVKWVETRRDGSTSRDHSVAPRQPLPDPQGRAKGLEVSGRCRPVSIPRRPCYTRLDIVALGFGSRRAKPG